MIRADFEKLLQVEAATPSDSPLFRSLVRIAAKAGALELEKETAGGPTRPNNIDPREIVTEVIAKVLSEKLYEDLRPTKSKPHAWLAACVRNYTRDVLDQMARERRARVHWEKLIEAEMGTDGDDDPDPPEIDAAVAQIARCERSSSLHSDLPADVESCLAALPPRDQFIVIRIFMGHDTYETLAKELDCPISTLRDAGSVARRSSVRCSLSMPQAVFGKHCQKNPEPRRFRLPASVSSYSGIQVLGTFTHGHIFVKLCPVGSPRQKRP